MKDFKGKVAVITGGAAGLGRAMAERFAGEGMKLVLADIEQKVLDQTAKEFHDKGAEVLPVRTDVTKIADLENLAKATYDKFGAAHVLCNNAGVAAAGVMWERSVRDWDWVLGVNLLAVIHGCRLFLPRMIADGHEGHIVNTASMAGLISGPGMSTYNVTKHGVVTLSETLFHELNMSGAKVKVSVLCPAWVNTGIADSARNRPADLENAPGTEIKRPMDEMLEKTVKSLLLQSKVTPANVADLVFGAVRDEKFYILPHPEWKDLIKTRMEDILAERNPTYVALM